MLAWPCFLLSIWVLQSTSSYHKQGLDEQDCDVSITLICTSTYFSGYRFRSVRVQRVQAGGDPRGRGRHCSFWHLSRGRARGQGLLPGRGDRDRALLQRRAGSKADQELRPTRKQELKILNENASKCSGKPLAVPCCGGIRGAFGCFSGGFCSLEALWAEARHIKSPGVSCGAVLSAQG